MISLTGRMFSPSTGGRIGGWGWGWKQEKHQKAHWCRENDTKLGSGYDRWHKDWNYQATKLCFSVRQSPNNCLLAVDTPGNSLKYLFCIHSFIYSFIQTTPTEHYLGPTTGVQRWIRLFSPWNLQSKKSWDRYYANSHMDIYWALAVFQVLFWSH